MIKTQTQKLRKLSICPCGFTLLDESIGVGTEYTVYPETVKPDCPFTLRCGGCGEETKGRGLIIARSILDPDLPPAPLPLELFDEWPEEIEEIS